MYWKKTWKFNTGGVIPTFADEFYDEIEVDLLNAEWQSISTGSCQRQFTFEDKNS